MWEGMMGLPAGIRRELDAGRVRRSDRTPTAFQHSAQRLPSPRGYPGNPSPKKFSYPNGVASILQPLACCNPFGVEEFWNTLTQGRLADSPTLG